MIKLPVTIFIIPWVFLNYCFHSTKLITVLVQNQVIWQMILNCLQKCSFGENMNTNSLLFSIFSANIFNCMLMSAFFFQEALTTFPSVKPIPIP